MSVMRWQGVDTPHGPFTIVADPDGAVRASGWGDRDAVLARLPQAERPRHLDAADLAAVEAVRAYYEGDLRALDRIAVRQSGTELRTLGWATLRKIEPGYPLTYSEFAEVLGRPTAVRAAAAVCAHNRAALFVPCHRVVAKDGSVHGFAWGTDIKRDLLAHETTHRDE